MMLSSVIGIKMLTQGSAWTLAGMAILDSPRWHIAPRTEWHSIRPALKLL